MFRISKSLATGYYLLDQALTRSASLIEIQKIITYFNLDINYQETLYLDRFIYTAIENSTLDICIYLIEILHADLSPLEDEKFRNLRL